jgi:ABC-type Fe3+-hydroxamate transport system substrate-binding protein
MADARDGLNLAALAAALALSTCVAAWWWRPSAGATAEVAHDRADASSRESPGGAVPGADGVAVPARAYRRIVSLDPAADDALVALGLVQRLRAISAWSAEHAIHARELAAVPARIAAGASAEQIASEHPDLVLVGGTSDPVRTARLRAGGLTVFACGGEGTASDVAAAARRLGAVLGEAAAGEALAQLFLARLAAVADDQPRRDGAVYCADYAGRLYGGAGGTAIHDVLAASGLLDLADQRGWKDFPEYHLEDLVAMQPRYLVTGTDSVALLRALPGIDQLRGCAFVAVDSGLLQITGIGLVESAEAVRAAYLRARASSAAGQEAAP